jgi:hypothetical protein
MSEENDNKKNDEQSQKLVETVKIVEAAKIGEIVEVIEVEELDIEEFCKMHGGKPPKARRYHIRIDREKYTVHVHEMTGRQILELAKKLPPENWLLNQKMKGGHVKAISLNEIVDFRAAGVERFMTLPKDQTEGIDNPRRQFRLPETDEEGLNAASFNWETIGAGGGGWFLVHDYQLPAGYNVETASLAVQIPGGYPNTPLDMVFFHPLLSRKDGRAIPRTEAVMPIDGKPWQRWSRHYTPAHPWIPGEYNIITHMALIRTWLEREFQRN